MTTTISPTITMKHKSEHTPVDSQKLVDMPCLRCGKLLELGNGGQTTVCACGAEFLVEEVLFHTRPGFYREWLAALSCTCGRVNHNNGESVTVKAHRCRAGGVGMLPRPSDN